MTEAYKKGDSQSAGGMLVFSGVFTCILSKVSDDFGHLNWSPRTKLLAGCFDSVQSLHILKCTDVFQNAYMNMMVNNVRSCCRKHITRMVQQ